MATQTYCYKISSQGSAKVMNLKNMPTKNPRITITVNEQLLELLETLAKERNESISQTARRLIEVGLEFFEDIGLSKIAEERLKDFSKEETLNHEEVWD
jgi:predicted DNA-binding protein